MKLNRHPLFTESSTRRGVALVITLVMLSVTLVMAVAFLALARRERGAVSTVTDTTTAKLAADSALAAAQSQILANVLADRPGTYAVKAGAYNFDLLVSTNYINTNGFNGFAGPLDVNYNHTSIGLTPLTPNDFLQNIADLQYLPRVPVFVQTNPGSPLDFRFYLDLNRNGTFDDTAYIDNSFTNGPVNEVGDPQWVGILARPDLEHSPNNQFLSRYAFIALPVGNTLDINAIHNQTLNESLNVADDGYYRNEGVGSWEINLAAFLCDLNSDVWNPSGAVYRYNEAGSFNSGRAFNDALSIVNYRYAGNYDSLAAPSASLYDALVMNGIDGYTIGDLLVGAQLPFVKTPPSPAYWAGSDNTNHFYNLPSDLFNPNKTGNFAYHLNLWQTNIANNYDRYTFYHLLAQLGTDSDPDAGKMNLNFLNVTNGVIVPGFETNCIAWSPLGFFTNAADRMLRMYTTNWFAANPYAYLQTYYGLVPGNYSEDYYNALSVLVNNDASGFGLTNFYESSSPFLRWVNVAPGFGITNIPVYVNGQFVYSPAVNRVLQLAANLYEASTNELYPSVFRPVFEIDRFTNVFIIGFTNAVIVSDPRYPGIDSQFLRTYDVTQLGQFVVTNKEIIPPQINVYGVPWIIGAKVGMPGFNQLAMLNMVQVNRRLQVGRKQDGTVYTNHMYELSISNFIGASFWNSYSNDYYPRTPGGTITTIFSDVLSLSVSNAGMGGAGVSFQMFTNDFIFTTNDWPGSRWSHSFGEVPPANAFVSAYYNNVYTDYGGVYASNIIYKTQARVFVGPNDPDLFESNNITCDPLPAISLTTTNWVRAIILDSGHVIDYVQLRGPMDATNLTAALNDPIASAGQPYLWATNAYGGSGGPSWGYVSQIEISQPSGSLPPGATWNPVAYPANLSSITAGQLYFKAFFTPSHEFTYNGNQYYCTSPIVQAGYTATRTIFVPYLYQVNDPLVHYTVNDLNAGPGAVWANGPIPNGIWRQADGLIAAPVPVPPLTGATMLGRYQPWGISAPGTLQGIGFNFGNPYNPVYKDPGVWDPDYWYFPTNKYPTVGWIGRVHRGTPWQTVYLKALNLVEPYDSVGSNTWAAWTGDDYNLYDAANSAPVQDRLLFDLFTTRPNDNAARGTLSVNQTNLAAWSAVLSGVVVLTNLEPIAPYGARRLATMISSPPKNLPFPVVNNTYNTIQPAGGAGANSTLAQLVAAINYQRANGNALYGFTNGDGVVGAFEHVGDILSVPQLTGQSPYLNTNFIQQTFGANDADYEWLPQQMLGLLRVSSTPRYVIYGYGQALRPAPNGLVSSGTFFGLVTNYQVVAESAVRAVISVQKQINLSGAYPVTNYTTRVEKYNVLPSD